MIIEFLLIVILVVLFINFSSSKSRDGRLFEALTNLEKRVNALQNGILSKPIDKEHVVEKVVKPVVDTKAGDVSDEMLPKPIQEEVIQVVADKPVEQQPIPVKPVEVTQVTNIKPIEVVAKIEAQPVATPYVAPKPVIPRKTWFETFKENNPDLEKFIGENLINKIGILILVLGISYFVKFAIDKDWINEPARVGIGILCGSLVMAIAHKLKKNYAAFSSVLVAGAISIFYLTIAIAFHEYHLFSQTVAFTIMTLITIFSVLVSVSYNRQELAVLSLIGGFAVPFMVSTGAGNYVVLFSYIAVLNMGILGIAYFRKWKLVTILAFIFTSFLFAFWYTRELFNNTLPHLGALSFATLFYFIFSITVVISNVKNKGIFSTIEYFIMVANTFFFFAIGIGIIHNWGIDFKGIFTLLLAVYNVVYAIVLYRKFGLDKNAIYLLIGLALTFLTLTIPLQFEGNQITLFWAAEAVLLFWLSQKSKIKHFKLGAFVVQGLTIGSLLLDWLKYDYPLVPLKIVLNPLFISGFVVSISLFLTYFLLKKEKEETKVGIFSITAYRTGLVVMAVIITYLTGFLEVNYQSYEYLANFASALSFSVTYHFVFLAILLFLVSKIKNETIHRTILIISTFSIFLYMVTFYRLPNNEMVQNYSLSTNTKFAFYFHYIILVCLIYFGYQLFLKAKEVPKIALLNGKWMPWLFVFATVYILSNEVMVHSLQFSLDGIDVSKIDAHLAQRELADYEIVSEKEYIFESKLSNIKTQIIKTGYPIVWGVFAFTFLIIGIRKQWKNLRIISLSLLGITVLKLFIYDIRNASEIGKIIALILLAVLILIMSFVYQKLKRLVVEDVPKTNLDEEDK